MNSKLHWLAMPIICILFFASQIQAQMLSRNGSYTGNGSDNRSISIGFQPDVVIVKGNTTSIAVCRISTMTGDNSKQLAGATAFVPNDIQAIESNGFQVGNSADVNSNGITYYWFAAKAYTGEMYVGSYTGNGTDNRSITVDTGIQPDYVIILSPDAERPTHRTSAHPASLTTDASFDYDGGSPNIPDAIQQIESNGFQVGTHARVNSNGVLYHYAAFKKLTGRMHVGTYTGDNVDNRNVTGLGFSPTYVIIKNDGSFTGVHRTNSVAGDSTLFFANSSNSANNIQSFLSDGFQLGNDTPVNNTNKNYFYIAFQTSQPTVVTLSGFGAVVNPDKSVTVTWETAAEIDNAGFNLYRARGKQGKYKQINDALIKAKGSPQDGAVYEYTDTPKRPGVYFYKLEDVDTSGAKTMHGPVKVKVKK